MKIALLQTNSIVGGLQHNAEKIIAAAKLAQENGADIIFTPEMSLTGYPVEDLLFRESFFPEMNKALDAITELDDITIVVGHPSKIGDEYFNSLSVYRDGNRLAQYHKMNLPNNSVFDEVRYFSPGYSPCIFMHDNIKIALMICEDSWHIEPSASIKDEGADLMVVINASPFYLGKQQERIQTIHHRIEETELPILYVNAVGGQDELVFDGCSFACNADHTLAYQGPAFIETLDYLTFEQQQFSGQINQLSTVDEEIIYQAALLGLKDYVSKSGFSKLCLGLSGGLDSALVLMMAVDAVGSENCEVLIMPSQYTSDLSNTAALKMTEQLAVAQQIIPITPIFAAFNQGLASRFAGLNTDITEENLQARIRGSLLMALSNKTGALLLSTGNKSEVAMGYCTLYGDMNGGFSPLKDIYKTQAYAIARWLNQSRNQELIPNEIIDRAPSAELRENQTDQDSLPDYAVLDKILALILEENVSKETLLKLGYTEETVSQILRLLRISEFKRRQGAIGPKVSKRAFGKDWRQPICHQFTFF